MIGQKIVGFDPGLHLTGYGVIEVAERGCVLVEAGVLRIEKLPELAERLVQLKTSASGILQEHRPAAVAVEALFSHYERPRTAVLMGHARGVLLLAAGELGIPVSHYFPTNVKKALTGNGRATKEQMQRAIQMEFALAAPPEPPDIADALAIALCHRYSVKVIF